MLLKTGPGVGSQESSAVPTAPSLEEQWAARIRPHLEAGVAGHIAAGLELIQAKGALKKQRGASLIHMVEAGLGWSIDAAEKWMAIARNPYLTDSANLRNLPTAWTTLYVLSPLKPEVLEEFAEAGQLHPALAGAEATALVRRASNLNGHGDRRDDGIDRSDDRSIDRSVDLGDDHDGDRGNDRGDDHHGDDRRARRSRKTSTTQSTFSPEWR